MGDRFVCPSSTTEKKPTLPIRDILTLVEVVPQRPDASSDLSALTHFSGFPLGMQRLPLLGVVGGSPTG